MNSIKQEQGIANPLMVMCILLSILSLVLGGAFIWAYSNYVDHRDNVQEKVEAAVTKAVNDQIEADKKDFLEKEKQPYSKLIGPEDLGSVSFSYPKTWSVYIAEDGLRGENYEAYLHPGSVPAVSASTPFATRLVISGDVYESFLRRYDGLVKKGDLRSNPITINNLTGVKLDGKFSNYRSGTMIVLKVRDKTVVVASDSTEFTKDFEEVVAKSIDFNP
ncbi:hypothetical protein EOL73_00950 [Candidatus Saccharibacteria bacterium]|nr:hypothetical protein [Candidatus Saccharibacteria bacterium]